jgi:hypothetical protein
MIVFILKNAESEIVGIGDIDAIILAEESFRVDRPSSSSLFRIQVFRDFRVTLYCVADVFVELSLVHYDSSADDWVC